MLALAKATTFSSPQVHYATNNKLQTTNFPQILHPLQFLCVILTNRARIVGSINVTDDYSQLNKIIGE